MCVCDGEVQRGADQAEVEVGSAGEAGRAVERVDAVADPERDPRLRTVHPWLGVGSVALAVLQAILGIQLLP